MTEHDIDSEAIPLKVKRGEQPSTPELEEAFDEHDRLLDDSDLDDGDDQVFDKDTDGSLLGDNSFKYLAGLLSIGVGYLLFRIIVALTAHGSHRMREPEALYYNGTDYFASLVIVVSLDGFRPDYLKMGITPHLDAFAEKGIQAEAMYPSFPSLTFPNHWTLVTGLYPGTHGIVANDFYDPTFNATFRHGDHRFSANSTWWNTSEPIWRTCQRHNRRTASVMWPGSAAIQPDYLADFNVSTTPIENVDMAIDLLDLDYMKRPQFLSVYMHHVDTAGHHGGPSNESVAESVQMVDDAIGHLMDQLEARNLAKHANVVIVSDHGMAKTDQFIYYDDILPESLLNQVQHREAWPLLDLRPVADAPANVSADIYDAFATYKQLHANASYSVFLRDETPEEFHYRDNERIAPVVLVPDVGHAFITHNDSDPTSGKPFQPMGMHGYDPKHPEMWAIFMASGPKVDKAYPTSKRLAPFHNVEVYEFLTELMNIYALPNNGSFHGLMPTL